MKALDKMAQEWTAINFDVMAYKSTGTYIVKIGDDVSQLLDDHIVMTQSMSFSPYKKPFEERISKWESQLHTTQVGRIPVLLLRVLTVWLIVRFLTPSTTAVPDCYCSKGSAPYWSNPQFLIFDIWALWRSVLSARAPKCQKLKMVG